MSKYIWQNPHWTNFTWDEKPLLPILSQIKLRQGRLTQKLSTLMTEDLVKTQAIILEQEALHTASIEGEQYDPKSIRLSIHHRLHLNTAGLPSTSDRHIDGLLDVLVDATSNPTKKLTLQRLFSWHASLFPTGYSRLLKIRVGKLRSDTNGPMQVVSGSIGQEKVHFEAPPAESLPQEIDHFLSWWDKSHESLDGIIRAGIAHFYFVTLHPFDDGNGRLARVITDMALAQDDQFPHRYYSMSQSIVASKKQYYVMLEKSQKGDSDLTIWLIWFMQCLLTALVTSESLLHNIFAKTIFWQRHHSISISDRQRKTINKILDIGQDNFIGGLTTRKYININHGISRRTAIREIQGLVQKGILLQNPGLGRNVSYSLVQFT